MKPSWHWNRTELPQLAPAHCLVTAGYQHTKRGADSKQLSQD